MRRRARESCSVALLGNAKELLHARPASRAEMSKRH
jgi:hypothetical protein